MQNSNTKKKDSASKKEQDKNKPMLYSSKKDASLGKRDQETVFSHKECTDQMLCEDAVEKKVVIDDDHTQLTNNSKKMLIIYTGGTLGMEMINGKLTVGANSLGNKLVRVKAFCDNEYSFFHNRYHNHEKDGARWMISPEISGKRLWYKVHNLKRLVDSSDTDTTFYHDLADAIEEFYDQYDAFQIIHGTDTMEFTASALSFMLKNIGKTVCLTGAQIPLSDQKNDAFINIMGSFRVIASYVIPEVTVYFQDKLMRGNRIKKIDSSHLNAFQSMVFPPLVVDDVFLQPKFHLIRKMPGKADHFYVNRNLSTDFVIFSVDTTLKWEVLLDILKKANHIRGVILKFPDRTVSSLLHFQKLLEELVELGKIVWVCSQSQRGAQISEDTVNYCSKLGVAYGYDISTAAAHAKMMHLLGQKEQKKEKILQLLNSDIVGEQSATHAISYSKPPSKSFVHKITDLVMRKTGDDYDFIKKNTMCMIETLLAKYNCHETIKEIAKLERHNAFRNPDVIKSTILHNICREGDVKLIKILQYECNVNFNVVDIYGRSPMFEALEANKKEVLFLLIENGYKAQAERGFITLKMHKFAKENDVDSFNQYCYTGFKNLNSYRNEDARTVLHTAVFYDSFEIINQVFSKFPINVLLKDRRGQTALDFAKKHNKAKAIELIESYLNHS